jgi:hypothetical protein
MFPSAEARWFYGGAIPQQVLQWFREEHGSLKEPADRVDHYLHLPDEDSLGIKLREGRLEIKQRHRRYGTVEFHERAAGLVEHWRKWSFQLAQGSDRLPPDMIADPPWIAVSKRRRLYRYRITRNREVVPVETVEYPEQGCDLELTSVKAEGRDWWTWGFEAFGEETALQGNLVLVAAQIFDTHGPPIVLGASHSHSYPAWLAALR